MKKLITAIALSIFLTSCATIPKPSTMTFTVVEKNDSTFTATSGKLKAIFFRSARDSIYVGKTITIYRGGTIK